MSQLNEQIDCSEGLFNKLFYIKTNNINLMENFFGSDKNDSLLHIYAGDVQCFVKILLQSTNKILQSSVDKRAKKCKKTSL